jgi:hypothetical protein
MKFKKPNFDFEWDEAQRYPEFEKMGKDGWIELSQNGFMIMYSEIKNVLGNVDLDFDGLDIDKKTRFKKAMRIGMMELPIVVKFSNESYDLIGGNTRLSGLVSMGVDSPLWVVDLSKNKMDNSKLISLAHKNITRTKGKDYAPNVRELQTWIDNHMSKQETTESMGADSAGSFEMAFNSKPIKRPITKIHNMNEEADIDEAMTADSAGAYDVPFGFGGKNPLGIGGEKSIKQSRAVKDKKFPKWGGPKGVYVRVKDKCKKFPYCNQGNTGALEFYEVDGLVEAVKNVSKKYGIPYSQMEKVVINEIKKIFIR